MKTCIFLECLIKKFLGFQDSIQRSYMDMGLTSTPPSLRKSFYQPLTPFLLDFIDSMLKAKAIKQTSSIEFQGCLFSVSEQNSSKRRIILDLSILNKSILCLCFKMMSVTGVRTILPQGLFTTFIDLQDAYWHIPIKPFF